MVDGVHGSDLGFLGGFAPRPGGPALRRQTSRRKPKALRATFNKHLRRCSAAACQFPGTAKGVNT
jgi:hypothetical protein